MTAQVKSGFVNGTASAVNVELGWIPDHVRVVNLTDGNKINENWLAKVMTFTSGSLEIVSGDKVSQSATIYGYVKQVILDSGSYAGGDAAGWLIFDADQIFGTFTSAAAEVNDSGDNDLTASAANQDGIDIDTEVAATTTAATNIAAYLGSATASKGFTIGATVSADGDLLGYIATRNAV
jgi:hypothetical protein